MRRKDRPEYSFSQIDYLINEYIVGYKGERNREILRLALIDGLTISEIAQIKDMSNTQVQRIIQDKGDPLLLMIKNDK